VKALWNRRITARNIFPEEPTNQLSILDTTMDKRRVGLLINALDQPGWVHEIVEQLVGAGGFELGALILADGGSRRTARSAPWTGISLNTVARLESRLLHDRQREMLAARDIRQSAPADVPVLTVTTRAQAAGGLEAVAETEVAQIGAASLDLIVAVGMSPVRGELALAARQGLWMLAHSELADGDAAHAGYWEVYQRADHTSVRLWKLGETEAGDELLDQRSFNTEYFWLKNRTRALGLGNLMLFDAMRALPSAPERSNGVGLQIHTAMARSQPERWDNAAYLARQAWLLSGMMMRRAMKKNVTWRIGMCPTEQRQLLTSEAAVLTPPKGRFFADPFVYTYRGHPYIFFEDYYFKERKGKISVATHNDGKFEFLGTVLDLPYHLSFPYIFEYNGTTYMVPETCGNGTIELWRCVEFPLKWELDTTLMSNVSAVDTIVFPHGGYWWLLTNIDRTGGQNHCDELFAFFADSPTSSDWRPHALNPIIRSPIKARNAGIVMEPGGDVIRCAQTQGFCHYGKGVSLNRIRTLSPDTYEEADGPIHYASFLRKPVASMHHWHHQGGHTVFDFAFME
jgi:hypothetical protein